MTNTYVIRKYAMQYNLPKKLLGTMISVSASAMRMRVMQVLRKRSHLLIY